jgi:hypothetical protein
MSCLRILTILTEALKRRGVYDASFQELQRLADAEDNAFIPVDNMAMLQAGGGLANVMQEAPLDNLIKALAQLYQSRQIVIQTIYEITGISDIMRGQSASRETATAQRIKMSVCVHIGFLLIQMNPARLTAHQNSAAAQSF